MEGVSPEYLLRPKERTYEGVCELLEQTKEELKQAEAKKNANEIEEKNHRIKILTLKKSKYARINEESENEKKEIKQAIQSSIPPRLRDQPRKESNFIVLDATMDEETAKKIILDAVNLLGNSPGLGRFILFLQQEDSNQSDTLIVHVISELEKNFKFGDEVLAKLIISHGLKSKDFEEFQDLVQHISNQYQFSSEFLQNLYKVVSDEKNSVFDSTHLVTELKSLQQSMEATILKISSSLSDKEKLFQEIVHAVEGWGSFLEIYNKIKSQLNHSKDTKNNLEELHSRKNRFIKNIANLLSMISYIQASVGSWNLENAIAHVDEANKSVWKAISILIEHLLNLLESLKETPKEVDIDDDDDDDIPKPRQTKLEKFFGVEPPQKKDPLAYLVEDEQFSRDLFFTMEGHVKGGSLEKLVERLTHHSIHDDDYTSSFLLTYKTFTDEQTLLKLLIQRYQLTHSEDLDPVEADYYIQKKLKPLQIKVTNFIKQWMEEDFQLFQTNDDLRAQLIEFNLTVVKRTSPFVAAQLDSLLNGHISTSGSLKSPEKFPNSIMPKNLKQIQFQNIDPLEIARQLTLIDFNIFSRISSKEFFKLAWSKKNSAENAPNITALIHRSTHLTSYVCTTILEEHDVRQRAEILKHFLLVCDKLKSFGNYNTLMAIHGGLMSSSIHRLQQTWKFLGKKEISISEEMRDLLSYQKNFGEYRSTINQAKLPCLPFLGLYLTDLTFIEDGNKEFLANTEFINFDKRIKISRVLLDIKKFQQTEFMFRPIPQLYDYFTNISHLEKNEEEFYEISQKVEKKETEAEMFAKVLENTGML